jgi:CSLREA domain-containing protein
MTTTTSRGRLPARLLMLLVAIAGLLAPASAVYAATITVTTTADEVNTNGACSLREALRAANLNVKVDSCPAGSTSSMDTITLPAGTFVLTRVGADEEASLTGDLDVLGGLKIVGAGAARTIIDGNAADRVLDVKKGARVIVSRVTLQNGRVGDYPATGVHGGGIYSDGNVTLNAVTIRNNSASADGAGIYNNGRLRVVGSTIDDNYAEVSGGGIFISAAATATVIRSTISRNDAEAIAGGIQVDGALAITSSTIDANWTQHGGGGIAVVDAGTAHILDSTISNNLAGESGGGLVTYGGTAVLVNSTVSGNRGGDSDSPTWGGGVDNSGGSLALFSSTVTANIGGTGGVVGPATLANTIVAGNQSLAGPPYYPAAGDCRGEIISRGYNLIGDATGCTITGDTTGNLLGVAANLGPLRRNGGPTMTHAPRPGSPAIDAGNPATPGSSRTACPATDQRGITRPQDGNGDSLSRCDIGAVERRSASQP